MKKNLTKWALMMGLCLMTFSPIAFSQSTYQIFDSKDNDLKLSGTSTLHDWSMEARTFTSEAQFDLSPGQLTALKTLTFALDVQNLKSGESGLDKNAYKALNTDKHKEIVYKLISAKVSPGNGNKYQLETHGNLSIAGVTKEITMNVTLLVNTDASIVCSGTKKIKMSDFQISPPSFLFGAMKTGDDLTLDFNLVYHKSSGTYTSNLN